MPSHFCSHFFSARCRVAHWHSLPGAPPLDLHYFQPTFFSLLLCPLPEALSAQRDLQTPEHQFLITPSSPLISCPYRFNMGDKYESEQKLPFTHCINWPVWMGTKAATTSLALRNPLPRALRCALHLKWAALISVSAVAPGYQLDLLRRRLPVVGRWWCHHCRTTVGCRCEQCGTYYWFLQIRHIYNIFTLILFVQLMFLKWEGSAWDHQAMQWLTTSWTCDLWSHDFFALISKSTVWHNRMYKCIHICVCVFEYVR